MTYYFSLILAIGITTLVSPQQNFFPEQRNFQVHGKYQLVAQDTSKPVEDSLSSQAENNFTESSVEPEITKANRNLFLSAIAVTSLFTIFLLSLLLKKVEVNLEDEVKEEITKEVKEEVTEEITEEITEAVPAKITEEVSIKEKITEKKLDYQKLAVADNWETKNSLYEIKKTILQKPEISQNDQLNNNKLSEQEQFQEDTVLLPPNISPSDVVLKLILELRLKDRQTRHKTIIKLAHKGDSRAMIPLVELMIQADPQERKLILGAIKKITNNTLNTMNKALIISLGDENSQIEPNTIRDLNRVYELMSEVTERLPKIINAPTAKAEATTEWAIRQLKKMPAISELKITKN